jgi:hypothetical protein
MKSLYTILFCFLATNAACFGVFREPPHSELPDASTPHPLPDAFIPGGQKRAFVTKNGYVGGFLGGLAGADTACTNSATAAGLGGRWAAWLSDSHTAARDRLDHAAGGYVLVDGTVIATTWNDLVTLNLQHAIDHDESGTVAPAPSTCFVVGGITPVWTGTNIDGTYAVVQNEQPSAVSCSDWTDFHATGVLGGAQLTNNQWTNSNCALGCDTRASLYCLEQ